MAADGTTFPNFGTDQKGNQLTGVDKVLARFNAKYAVVREGGKALVFLSEQDPILNRRYYQRITFDDLKKLYLNRRVQVPDGNGGTTFKNAAAVWLGHEARREYLGGVVFDPRGTNPTDVLNLWQDFGVEARTGSWALMKAHILNVVCAGDTEHNDYLLDWLANLFQKPYRQGEVAVVLQGREGCGKGILARAVKHVLGQHGLVISNAKHLVGNFNAHLQDCIFLFADEAFFAGDKQHVGILKSLITEPLLTIERKYSDAVQSPNFLHILMASNDDWVVPASLDARRFFVLRVADDRIGDLSYFAAIQHAMENGGYEAMLYELVHRDISGFNVRNVPKTEALKEQQKLSLDTTHAWWVDVLQRGYVYESRIGLHDYFGHWQESVSTELLFRSYEAFATKRHERRPLDRERLGKFLVSLGFQPMRPRGERVIGEHMTEVAIDDQGAKRRQAAMITSNRAPSYRMPPLAAARATFASRAGLHFDWCRDDEDDQPP